MFDKRLRVVVLTSFLPNYRMVANWAQRHGHEIVLVLTPPLGDSTRYGSSQNSLLGGLPAEASVLVTKHLRSVATPVIAALEPDLLISAAFPRLIPAEILDLPTHGAVNLHPSALPAGRGPNPMRLLYEGATTIGATLHRTDKEFDTGAVLSQRERPLPADLSGPAVLANWLEMLAEVLEEGTVRAAADDPGIVQDATKSSYAGKFTDAEMLLDLTEAAATLTRKSAALNVLAPRARVRIDGVESSVLRIDAVPADLVGAPVADSMAQSMAESAAVPGTVLATHSDGWTAQAGDGAVRIISC